MKKYKSELYEVLHELDLDFFEAGAISEDEFRELEKDCFIDEDETPKEKSLVKEHKSA